TAATRWRLQVAEQAFDAVGDDDVGRVRKRQSQRLRRNQSTDQGRCVRQGYRQARGTADVGRAREGQQRSQVDVTTRGVDADRLQGHCWATSTEVGDRDRRNEVDAGRGQVPAAAD